VFAGRVAALKAGFVFASSVWFPILGQKGGSTPQVLTSILKKMKKNTSINTMIATKMRELRTLRKSCVEWRQKEIDNEINELKKLKEDVKKCR
jgi:hypothetical protein